MTDSHSLLLLVRCIAVYALSSWNLLEAAGGMNEELSGRARMLRPTSVEDEKEGIVDAFLAKDGEEEAAAAACAPQATAEVVTVHFDPETSSSKPFPDDIRAALERAMVGPAAG